ncbi:uncharacterized protein STEHIDRAFT_55480 [Stereum hirsutum FP-91666 SS1]|uniref:uncharacterized protein n=1 Tax=Stereum hirsutum (strain FP-91666) TaxID=721885 RepID=UPI000440DB04|nr:uncharacterized protein STEHIDRAFT_55480 [Stereum hirsutum FP-91666 SS1]EIM88325.1 hypothetical protein STEHIDRAFT_55480 [Stereum hirsutum FP-91666 SS1]
MTTKRNELFRKYKCTPFATMLIPPLSQLPLFALTSVTLSHACQAPTILDSESFLTITSLSHPDPTTALPIALGLISLANVESAKWWVSDVARERLEVERKKKEENEKRGVREIKPRELVQGALRALSVGRILLGALVPGGVLIYWVSSAAFGLLQTWAFDYWDYRRAQARRHLEVQATKTSTAKTLAQTPPPAPLPPRSLSTTTKPSNTKVWTVQPPRAKSSKGKRR